MKPYAEHRKARHLYDLLEMFEGGLVLSGNEVKSVREGGVKLEGSFLQFLSGELWLVGTHIAPYSKGGVDIADPTRRRKVLLQARELCRLIGKIEQKGLTLVPLAFYPKGRRIKISFALARGKQLHNKKNQLKTRDIERQTARFLRGRDE